ncbi:MAG: type II toxin-antitoxin system Phd/YefM family antitoxin [Desulfobacterales bacterium]|nr:type II toxin-antitoxin system Phd/YefM family antitoxin [Desulfobacterales bacterium]
MEEIQLSNFQKNFHIIIDSVSRSNKPVLITDKGKKLIKIIPVRSDEEKSWIGCMKGTGRIKGDIISPAQDPGIMGSSVRMKYLLDTHI